MDSLDLAVLLVLTNVILLKCGDNFMLFPHKYLGWFLPQASLSVYKMKRATLQGTDKKKKVILGT